MTTEYYGLKINGKVTPFDSNNISKAYAFRIRGSRVDFVHADHSVLSAKDYGDYTPDNVRSRWDKFESNPFPKERKNPNLRKHANQFNKLKTPKERGAFLDEFKGSYAARIVVYAFREIIG